MKLERNLSNKNRIVVKIGTSSLTYSNGSLNLNSIDKLAMVLSDLHNRGKEVILVTSAAIAVGTNLLGLSKRPSLVEEKQACAAIGQAELVHIYQNMFSKFRKTVAQILITRDGLEDPKRLQNARNTIYTLLKMGVIPIINENDTIATEEIEFGDNDTLAGMVSKYINADLMIIMSDVEGLYSADPSKTDDYELISTVEDIEAIKNLAGGAGSEFAKGGMKSKIAAAEICTSSGVDMVIVSGEHPEIIFSVIENKNVGTLFCRQKQEKKYEKSCIV